MQFFQRLTPQVIFGIILVAVVLLALTLTLIFVGQAVAPSHTGGLPTAVLNVVPAPTFTPILPTSTLAPPATETPEVPPSPMPGEIGIGAFVQVSGTEGDGLRIRSQPGLQGDILFVALEAEVFQVAEGPQVMDGYTWWRLISPSNSEYQGWAVANYLEPIENP